jgi:hypothetical protein
MTATSHRASRGGAVRDPGDVATGSRTQETADARAAGNLVPQRSGRHIWRRPGGWARPESGRALGESQWGNGTVVISSDQSVRLALTTLGHRDTQAKGAVPRPGTHRAHDESSTEQSRSTVGAPARATLRSCPDVSPSKPEIRRSSTASWRVTASTKSLQSWGVRVERWGAAFSQTACARPSNWR